MGIFSRISDIINANINAMLDSAENPEKMIRLVIQEMEETLVEVRTNSARIIADKKDLTRRQERLVAQADEWQRKAELALSKGREDLAKAALLEKSGTQDAINVLSSEQEKLELSLDRLTDEIEKLQDKLNDAKARQKALLMRTRATESRAAVNQHLNSKGFESAMSKLDYFENKIDRMEGQIEADKLGSNNLENEFKELELQDKIDQELAALKKKMQGEDKAD